MTIKRSEIIDYLIKQGYPKEELEVMVIRELTDLYEMYHED